MRDGEKANRESDLIDLNEGEGPDLIELVEGAEESENNLIELNEAAGEPEVLSEDELIVLSAEEDDGNEETANLLFDDVIELDDEEEEEELVAGPAIEGLERIDDSMADFLSNISQGNLIELVSEEVEDPIELDTDEERVAPREGIETPPQESLAKLLDLSRKRIMFLEKRVSAPGTYKTDNSKELLEFVMNIKAVPFLTFSDQAYLLSLVEALDKEEDVIKVFLQDPGRKIEKKNMFDFSNYVRQIMTKLKGFNEKTEIMAGIRGTINKFILNQFIQDAIDSAEFMKRNLDSTNICYVKSIKTGSKQSEFECGNCGEINENGRFFKAIVSENIFASESITLFPLARTCSHCKFLNILTFAEHQVLNATFSSKYDETVSEWRRMSKKSSSFGNIISYRFSKDILPEVKGNLYSKTDEVVEQVDERLEFNTATMNRWYEETVEAIKVLKSTVIDKNGGFYMEEGRLSYDKSDHRETITELAKAYCNLFREDYNLVKTNAVNSILVYFRENPVLMGSLSPDLVYKKEALVLLKGYIGADMPDEELDNIYALISKNIGIEYNSILVDGSLSPENKSKYEKGISESVAGLQLALDRDKRNLQEAIESLDGLIPLFRFIEIKNSNKQDLKEFYPLLVNDGVVEWMDFVADLMVINKMSDKILQFWKTLGTDNIKHKTYLNTKRTTKSFGEIVTSLIDVYGNYFRNRGSKSSPKLELDNFLSTSFTSTTVTASIFDLKSSVETIDYYKFCYAVTAISKKFEHKSSAFNKFREFLAKYSSPCAEFCKQMNANSSGNKLLDYYLYHFGHIFSKEEIAEGAKDFQGFVKVSFLLPREDDEPFGTYLRRLRASAYDEGYCLQDKDLDKFKEMNGYLPALYAVFEYYRFVSGTKEGLNHKLLINDLVYYAYFYQKKFMYQFLGVNKLHFEVPDRSLEDFRRIPDPEEYRIEFIIDNLVYPSLEFNALVSGGDDEGGAILDVLKDDPDTFTEQFRYFEDFGGHVNKHYSSGRE
jgi:hypothetical protein